MGNNSNMDFRPDLRNTKWLKGYRDMPEAYVRVKTPGVTTILNDMIPNPEIEEWIKKVGQETADKITQAANDRGTSMHMFIEIFLKKLKETGDPSAALRETQVNSPILLKEENIPEYKIKEGRDMFYKFYDSDYITDYEKLIGTETDIYSPFLYYRGKIDWVFLKKIWGLSVRDFKGSSKPIESGSRKEEGYKYQLGAYSLALEHMYKADKKNVKVGYASIVNIQAKSNIVQNIECSGEELENYKRKFESIIKKWHIKYGQGFLLK